MQLHHQNKHYALGLHWATALDAGEARRECKSRPKAARVLMPAAGQVWVGLYDDPVKGATHAAALAVGLIEPNVIVCEQVDDTHSWICAIVDAMPAVGYDLLLPTAEARDMVAQWPSMFPKAQFIGDLPGAKSSLVEVLNELEKGIASKRVSAKHLAATRLQSQGVSMTSVVTLLAVLVIPVSGWYGWQAWLKIRAASAAHQVSMTTAAKQAMNAEQVAAERRRKTEEFHREVAAKRAALEQQASTAPEPLWRTWQGVRRSLPLAAFGYEPKAMRCDTVSCKVEWSGSGPMTLPADKRRLPGVQGDLEPTLAATSVFPLPAAFIARAPLQAFGSPEELRFALASAATVALPGLQVDPMQPVVVTPAPDLGLAAATLGAVGKVRITLNGPAALVLADDALTFLARWPVQLASIQFSSLGPVAGAISIEGTYALIGQP